jgi:N-acetylglucosamine-6-phosphate deacetylase
MSPAIRHAIAADCVFDGMHVHRDAVVLIEGPRISAVVPRADAPTGIPVRALPDGTWLAPGFVDLQVNGGGDVLFNDQPTIEGVRAIAAAHRRFGTTALLPTLISDTRETMKAALDAVQASLTPESNIIGIHFEGPFLSPEKPGVHALRHIRKPDEDDLAMLTGQRRGVMLITLAPEQVPAGFVRQLIETGVRVSLGHSMATYAETRAAMVEGMTGFTHLFNAMRPLSSRDPGPIAVALEAPDAWFGMIVDGVHVDPAVLRLALRGAARPMLVTDAMPPVGGTQASFTLYGETIVAMDGKCLRGDGTLAGAALDMATAVRNCVRLLGMPLEFALRAAATHPADFVGLGHWLGRLAPGYRADVVAIDPIAVKVLETWIAGRAADSA